MIKKIKPEKVNDFLVSFIKNPNLWRKKQIDEGFEFEEEIQMKIIETNPKNIPFIENPSEEVCLAAVNKHGWAIEYIKNPSQEVCLAAVKQHGWAIEYIKNPSQEVCLAAVKQNGWAIQFIKNPSEVVCLAAVKQDWYALRYIKNPSEKVRLAAVCQSLRAIEFIKKPYQTPEIIEEFFKTEESEDFKRIDFYKFLSEKLITKDQALTMVSENPDNINFVSRKIQKEILELKPGLNKFLEKDLKIDRLVDFFLDKNPNEGY